MPLLQEDGNGSVEAPVPPVRLEMLRVAWGDSMYNDLPSFLKTISPCFTVPVQPIEKL